MPEDNPNFSGYVVLDTYNVEYFDRPNMRDRSYEINFGKFHLGVDKDKFIVEWIGRSEQVFTDIREAEAHFEKLKEVADSYYRNKTEKKENIPIEVIVQKKLAERRN